VGTRIFLLLSACLILGVASAAQQPEAPNEVQFRAESRQVLVPVVVTDKKGHHVTGLKAEDFQVSEDGVPQKIVAFSSEASTPVAELPGMAGAGGGSGRSATAAVVVPASPAAPANATATAAGGLQKRTYVIAFDTLHSSFANFSHVRDALEQFFKRDRADPNIQYVLIGLGRQLRVIQTATSDPATVLARIRGTGFLDTLRGVDAQAMATEVNNLRLRMEQYCRTCPCGPAAKGSVCYPERQDLRQQVSTQAERTAIMTRGFLESLKSLIAELGNVPTNRALILISDGFSLQPGSEFYGVAAAYLPNYADFRFSPPEQMEPLLINALSTAVRRNISIYAIDSRGVSSPSFASGGSADASNSGAGGSSARNRGGSFLTELDRNQRSISFQNGSGMSQLAASTGGVYFHESNDVLKELQTAVGDGREYYVLTYIPTNSSQDGKFRKIGVEMRDRTVNVRAKEGYWAN
jgi:VWFA-related protein